MTRGRTLAGERDWAASARGSARRFRIERIERVRQWQFSARWPFITRPVVRLRYWARDRHGFLLEVGSKGEPLPSPPNHPNCRCTTGDSK